MKIQKTFHKVSLQVCKHKKHSVSRNYTFGNTNSTIFSVFEGRVGWMVGESLYSYSLFKLENATLLELIGTITLGIEYHAIMVVVCLVG